MSRDELDVTDRAAVDGAVTADVCAVLHLAALTDVDACERQPGEAMRVNAEGTRNVRDAARRSRTRVIYLSTDYVFDGSNDGEYAEDDSPHPINHYGRSKLQGEGYVREDRDNLVVRTSWIIGDGTNFVQAIIDAAASRDELAVVQDQRARPTLAEDLAKALATIIKEPWNGCIHITGDGPICSRAELARTALAIAGLPTKVRPVDTDTYAEMRSTPIAPRPCNSALSIRKAKTLGVPLTDWRTSLERYLKTRSVG